MQNVLLWLYFIIDVLLSNFRLLKRPFRLFIVVTKKCQSRCQHCKIWQEVPNDELTVRDYEKIAQNSPWLKWLHLTGGEPTDRDDFVDIVRVFHRHCNKLFFLNFTTNGLQPERIEHMLKQVAVLQIPKVVVSVSIDGPPAINDSLRGIDGDFEFATDTLKRLRAIKGIQTQVSMTLFQKNRLLIQETFVEIKKKVPDFQLSDMTLNTPHTSSHFFGNQKMKLTASQELLPIVQKYAQAVGRQRSILWIFKKSYFRLLRKYIQSGKSPVSCAALRSSVYISEKGNLFPCTIWSQDLGHIRDYEFDVLKALHSSKFLSAKEMIAKLQCPNCWTPCEAFPNMLVNLHRLIL